MAQEGDWIYTLDEEVYGRLQGTDLKTMDDNMLVAALAAISLSRIALNLERFLLNPELPLQVEIVQK